MGSWADGHVFPDGVVSIHSPATIKSLLKSGLLEGNVGGEFAWLEKTWQDR
jgi:hypothetical protein